MNKDVAKYGFITKQCIYVQYELLFLVQVLAEFNEHHELAFRVGLFALEMARPPASTKALEVKLNNQETELVALLKRLPTGAEQLALAREKAQQLCDGTLR